MERVFSVKEYFGLFVRRKWHFLIPLLIVVSVSTIFTLMLPKVYLSRASILIQTREASPIKGIFQPRNLNLQRFALMKEILRSRAKIEEIIKKLGLEQNVDGPKAYETLISIIKRGTVITMRGTIISVAYRGDDPHTVMQITNLFTGYFVDQDINLMVGASGPSAIPVLQELVDYYERRVNTARGVMAKFNLENKGVMRTSLDKDFKGIEANQLILAKTEVSIREEMGKKRLLEKRLAGNDEKLPDFEFVQKKLTSDEKQLNQLYVERDSLLAKYTPRHPEVIRLKSKIEALKRKILVYYSKAGNDTYIEEAVNIQQISLSPQYLKLRRILDETNRNIIELQAKKEQKIANIQNLNERVSTVPQIQQEYAALRRDLNVNKKIYKTLLTKVEKAQLAKEIEAMQQSSRFAILRPARLALKPIAPNVGRNIIVATLVGALIGVSLALWSEFSDHSLRNLADAKEYLSIPILSTIPTVRTDEEILKKRRINMMIAVTGTFYILFFVMLITRELIMMYAPNLFYLQTYKELFYQFSDLFK